MNSNLDISGLLEPGAPMKRSDVIPDVDDNAFLDMLEKKYNADEFPEASDDEGSVDRESFGSNKAFSPSALKKGLGNDSKKEKVIERQWAFIGGGNIAPRFGDTMSDFGGDNKEKEAVFDHTVKEGGLFNNIANSPIKDHIPSQFKKNLGTWTDQKSTNLTFEHRKSKYEEPDMDRNDPKGGFCYRKGF